MIDVINKNEISLKPATKHTDIINAKEKDPAKLVLDQENNVLKIFFTSKESKVINPNSFTFTEFAYAGMQKSGYGINLCSSPEKDLKITKLKPNHAYAVDRAFLNKEQEIVMKLYNPHGFYVNESKRYGAKLTLDQICDNFNRAYIFQNKDSNDSDDFYLI